MNPVSNTAYYCCGVRMDDSGRDRPVCNDIYAQRFMDEAGMQIYAPFRSEKMPNISNIARCRIIDDHVAAELDNTAEVNVITIGAGFDTRPYRLAGGNWIELDEPPIIEYKNNRLPLAECSNPLQRIAIDFADESLSDKLAHTGSSAHTIIVIEGVFIYLDQAAIENTLDQVQRLFPEHELYCDLMSRPFFEKYAQRVHDKLIAAGARFSERPQRPEEVFLARGYRLVEREPMFARAIELGLPWDEIRLPGIVARLALNLLMRDLRGYAVHHFRFSGV